MTKYSEIIVVFWLIPVVLQIVLPLIMLIFFGTVKAMRTVFFRKEAMKATVDGEVAESNMQPIIT